MPQPKTPEQLKTTLSNALDNFPEVTAEEPYLQDAKAFLTQAIACLEKQIRTNV